MIFIFFMHIKKRTNILLCHMMLFIFKLLPTTLIYFTSAHFRFRTTPLKFKIFNNFLIKIQSMRDKSCFLFQLEPDYRLRSILLKWLTVNFTVFLSKFDSSRSHSPQNIEIWLWIEFYRSKWLKIKVIMDLWQ